MKILFLIAATLMLGSSAYANCKGDSGGYCYYKNGQATHCWDREDHPNPKLSCEIYEGSFKSNYDPANYTWVKINGMYCKKNLKTGQYMACRELNEGNPDVKSNYDSSNYVTVISGGQVCKKDKRTGQLMACRDRYGDPEDDAFDSMIDDTTDDNF